LPASPSAISLPAFEGLYGHIMTSLHRPSPSPTPTPTADGDARISFRHPVTEAGFVDAGWWPRSLDLRAELPPLFEVLWTAGRDVDRVSYSLAFWAPVPRQMRVAERVVRLGGFHAQDPSLLTLFDSSGREHVDILVVRPEADADFAMRVLQLAGGAGSIEQPDRILELAAAPARDSSRRAV
jgi:hypothetical protein